MNSSSGPTCSTHLWSPTECGGGSLWLYTFFAQTKIRKHHVALDAPDANRDNIKINTDPAAVSVRSAEVPGSPEEYSLVSNLCNRRIINKNQWVRNWLPGLSETFLFTHRDMLKCLTCRQCWESEDSRWRWLPLPCRTSLWAQRSIALSEDERRATGEESRKTLPCLDFHRDSSNIVKCIYNCGTEKLERSKI